MMSNVRPPSTAIFPTFPVTVSFSRRRLRRTTTEPPMPAVDLLNPYFVPHPIVTTTTPSRTVLFIPTTSTPLPLPPSATSALSSSSSPFPTPLPGGIDDVPALIPDRPRLQPNPNPNPTPSPLVRKRKPLGKKKKQQLRQKNKQTGPLVHRMETIAEGDEGGEGDEEEEIGSDSSSDGSSGTNSHPVSPSRGRGGGKWQGENILVRDIDVIPPTSGGRHQHQAISSSAAPTTGRSVGGNDGVVEMQENQVSPLNSPLSPEMPSTPEPPELSSESEFESDDDDDVDFFSPNRAGHNRRRISNHFLSPHTHTHTNHNNTPYYSDDEDEDEGEDDDIYLEEIFSPLNLTSPESPNTPYVSMLSLAPPTAPSPAIGSGRGDEQPQQQQQQHRWQQNRRRHRRTITLIGFEDPLF